MYSFGRDLDGDTAAADLAGRLVDLEIPDAQHGRRERARTARERLDAGEELLERERLGDVVIRARAQRRHLGVDRVLRGEDEHGPLEALGAKRLEHVEPALARQSHVENDEVVRLRARAALSLLAVGHQIDRPPMLLEPALHVLPDRRIILDDENPHRRYSTPPGRRKPYSRIFR